MRRHVRTKQRHDPRSRRAAPQRIVSWYQRIITASTALAKVVAAGILWGGGLQIILDLVTRSGWSGARYAWFASVSALVLAGTLLVRSVARHRLRSLRRQGLAVRRTLTVGPGRQITAVVDRLSSDTDHPFVVVGACVEGESEVVEDVPQLSRLPLLPAEPDAFHDDEVVRRVLVALDKIGADTVCIAPGSQFTNGRLRALGWALSERGVALVSELGLEDVATHRLWVRRAGTSTILHIGAAPLEGVRRVVKSCLDRVLAGVLLVALAPILLMGAIAVKVSSSGPVIYRQTRVGRAGRRFTMLKFRSMFVDADQRRESLLASVNVEGPMFKMYDDPRVTRVGRILRKYSLDELPQLVNVVRGEMSLVGPRPPLVEEVATYDQVEMRRLLVTPGITGLWQVSGRSNLTWDETVRLDLRYVDNWTIRGDARLLGRTAGAVVRGTGAY
ncbi:sugar transferase [Phytoactinopolyspora alkaliphila]|uniref:Sugar transferase n=1 Tax=Phytoactinopolyspora alkaliphila TaxID=1783498 RepID=A0A6N9YJJ8_9ACTN|nr:sugar transferase [Phytoactinopolyspora alkaliphila]